ncbi:hypothetical protein [Lysobacter sp. TAB13]|uniref:hypothetical protein n=1 Tax=Lysobacter sp. TAB13 TaxID=3233065 RepID=UPI003F9D9289
MQDDFTRPGSILRPFPDAGNVFAPGQESLQRHLHPLVSIDLSAVRPQWSGWLHLLSPLEPCDGLVGQYTEDEFHGELLRSNWIGFAVEDGRYRLLGDARYFLLERSLEETPPQLRGDRAELEKHYLAEERAYRVSRDYYREHGRLVRLNRFGNAPSDDTTALDLVERLGGFADAGYNWEETVEFPLEYGQAEGVEQAVWPLSPSGRRFEHVASVPGWNYRKTGADLIVLFYEPVEQLALLTFDWT